MEINRLVWMMKRGVGSRKATECSAPATGPVPRFIYMFLSVSQVNGQCQEPWQETTWGNCFAVLEEVLALPKLIFEALHGRGDLPPTGNKLRGGEGVDCHDRAVTQQSPKI